MKCHDDADFGRRFIYRQQVARTQEHRHDTDLRQNRRQEERGGYRFDSESDGILKFRGLRFLN